MDFDREKYTMIYFGCLFITELRAYGISLFYLAFQYACVCRYNSFLSDID